MPFRENEVVLRAEVPGVKKEDLEVTVQDEILTIHGEVKQEAEEEKGRYRWREMSYGAFSRSVPLPAGVDADKIKVTFKERHPGDTSTPHRTGQGAQDSGRGGGLRSLYAAPLREEVAIATAGGAGVA